MATPLMTLQDLLSQLPTSVSPRLLAFVAVIIVVPLLLFRSPAARGSGRERDPPAVYSSIPFIGHALGLMQHHHNYHRILLAQHGDAGKAEKGQGHEHGDSGPGRGMPGILALPILTGRMYAVFQPGLAQAVMKSRILSFEPYVSTFIRRMTSCSNATLAVFDGEPFHSTWLRIIYSSLTGQELLRVNRTAVSVELAELNAQVPMSRKKGAALEVDNLWDWVLDLMTLATTTALYGEGNPFKDKALRSEYWYV